MNATTTTAGALPAPIAGLTPDGMVEALCATATALGRVAPEDVEDLLRAIADKLEHDRNGPSSDQIDMRRTRREIDRSRVNLAAAIKIAQIEGAL